MEKSCTEMDTEDWELLPIPNHSPNTLELGLESGRDLLFSEEADLAFVDNHYFTLPSQPSKNQELVKDRHVFKNMKDDTNAAAEPPSFSSEDEGMDEKEEQADHDHGAKEKPCREGLGPKAWSWKLAGGVAAVMCVLAALGGRQQPKHEPRFQIYADDEKRIKQVMQQATRLNRALTAVRGAPTTTTRANISFGGYYDGL